MEKPLPLPLLRCAQLWVCIFMQFSEQRINKLEILVVVVVVGRNVLQGENLQQIFEIDQLLKK